MKSELTLALNEITDNSKLKRDVIIEALEAALVTAYRKALNASAAQHVVAKVDASTGQIRIFAEKEVVESVLEPNTEVTLEEAHLVDTGAQLGDMVTVESTPRDFGRIAAQSAKQVILQKLREAEREHQFQEYSQREGEVVSGTVQAVNNQSITVGLARTEATLPRSHTLPGERYYPHQKVRAFVLEVKKGTRGPQIILSRTHRNMLRRLLEYEVPEIENGAVELKSIAREPGYRSKVAVAARQPGIDPVGACVGVRGVRIQSIVKELSDEKVDVIEYSPDPALYIAKALSPARVNAVYLDDDPLAGRTAVVVVPDDQLSLAIGREGQNARLAAKLTNWRIDIKSLTEAAQEAFRRLREDAFFAEITESYAGLVHVAEGILAKKLENKPLTPEEYSQLMKLVDVVERRAARGRQSERTIKEEKVAAIRATIPASAWKMPLGKHLPDPLARMLIDADYLTLGEVMEELAIDENRLWKVEGLGQREFDELKRLLAEMPFEETEIPAVPEPEPTPAVATPVAPDSEAVADPQAVEEVDDEMDDDEDDEDDEDDDSDSEVAGDGLAVETNADNPEAKDDETTVRRKGTGKKKAKKRTTMETTYDDELGVYVRVKKRKASRASDFFEG